MEPIEEGTMAPPSTPLFVRGEVDDSRLMGIGTDQRVALQMKEINVVQTKDKANYLMGSSSEDCKRGTGEGVDLGSVDFTGQFDMISKRVAELAEEKNSLLTQLKQGRGATAANRPTQPGDDQLGGKLAGLHRLPSTTLPTGKENMKGEERAPSPKNVRFSSPLLTPKSNARSHAAEAASIKSTPSMTGSLPVHDADERARQAVALLQLGEDGGSGRWHRLLLEADERADELAREVRDVSSIL